MKKTTILAIASSAILLCASCDRNQHDVFAPDELGMPEHEYYVGVPGGDIDIDYLANKQGSVSLMDPSDGAWIQLLATTFDADGSIPVRVRRNEGFQRRADLLFRTDTRKDTVSVFQSGAVEERFYVSANSVIVYNGTGEVNTIATDINVPLENIRTEVRYGGGEEWIQDCRLTSTALTFRTTDNTDRNYTRRASIVLTYTDGWKKKQNASISVLQARADNNIGTPFTPEQLREVATVAGYTLPDDAIVEGYIVSTTEGGNAGDAQVEDYKQGTGVIDYTLSERTAYLESADGRYGFRLVAVPDGENGFTRYSLVNLKIGGAVVKKSDGEPVCYTIEGVSSGNLITSTDGTQTMRNFPGRQGQMGVKKEKTLARP